MRKITTSHILVFTVWVILAGGFMALQGCASQGSAGAVQPPDRAERCLLAQTGLTAAQGLSDDAERQKRILIYEAAVQQWCAAKLAE